MVCDPVSWFSGLRLNCGWRLAVSSSWRPIFLVYLNKLIASMKTSEPVIYDNVWFMDWKKNIWCILFLFEVIFPPLLSHFFGFSRVISHFVLKEFFHVCSLWLQIGFTCPSLVSCLLVCVCFSLFVFLLCSPPSVFAGGLFFYDWNQLFIWVSSIWVFLNRQTWQQTQHL